MRVLIVSDTHGRHGNFDRALEEAGQIDVFIHLGDVEGGEDYMDAVIDCEKHMVRGNNDFFSDLPREEEFRPFFEQKDGITVLNPGSLSFPRQEGRKGSYMIMEIEADGTATYDQRYLG